MNWKIFITACVSAAIVCFPQNIIGCGPQTDPYDYYVSFFHQNLPNVIGLQPFYYGSAVFLYEEKEPAEVSDLLAKEWATYCGNGVSEASAKDFVNKFSYKDIEHLNQTSDIVKKIPDSVLKNSMSKYFAGNRNNDALNYIVFAKKTEPFVIGNADSWEPVKRDSVQMNTLINTGQQLYNTTKDKFLQLKYGYQITRLALYSKNYKASATFYDDLISNNPTESVLKSLSLSLKAGAVNGLGNKKKAAYFYSLAFNESIVKRLSNSISFGWMYDVTTDRNDYLKTCKNNKEKAGMLALFALESGKNELPAIKKIYALDAGNSSLVVLITREINKLEEQYLTPQLLKDKGRRKSIFYLSSTPTDSTTKQTLIQMEQLVNFLSTAAKNNKLKNAGLFKTAAGYISYLMKDFTGAKKYIEDAEKMTIPQKIRDQCMLTRLLITISEQDKIDSNFEAQILPSIKWLGDKVIEEKKLKNINDHLAEWGVSYRNLMNEIIAPRYHKQGDLVKETLAIGAADWIHTLNQNSDYYYNPENAIEFMRNNLSSKEVMALNTMMLNKNLSKFENYILAKNTIAKNIVSEYLGTAYLREYDFVNATKYFNRLSNKKVLSIDTNPFADLMYDKEEKTPNEKNFITNKIVFAKEMQNQLLLAKTDKVNTAKHLYKIATGMYNMTYYGHAWLLVQYYRSSVDGYYIAADASNFEKEYYGCFTALSYFKKAMDASADKNFKARCLFMMAKCSQKQIQKPQYFMFDNNYNKYDDAIKGYAPRFMNNIYFPQLIKDYGNTNFYKEAYKSCSYLSDFEGAQ